MTDGVTGKGRLPRDQGPVLAGPRRAGAIEVAAPGKINVILRVLDRRPDHYHNLWSVMQTIELADTVVVEADDGISGIQLACEGADLPIDARNLAYRAAECVLARLEDGPAVAQTRDWPGVRILIRKRLPVAAGLGGGSSDAAATIQALATLFEARWSPAEMARIGQELGSDVPFFFFGPAALVEGRGERVSSLRVVGGGWLVLVNPGIAIPTPWAYARLADARAHREAFLPRASAWPLDSEGPSVVTWEDLVARAENDFGSVMEQEYPLLRELRRQLLQGGAQAALLAGSGSTVFGIFPSEERAHAAAAGLAGEEGCRVWVTRTRTATDAV